MLCELHKNQRNHYSHMPFLIPYLSYLWRCRSLHTIHSPFVYEFCTKVLPSATSDVGKKIEDLRQDLLQDNSIIEWEDLGAGFQKQAGMLRKSVREIAKSSARKDYEGELLYRICKYYQPKRCLEFGTNLGISTLYQHAAIPNSQFVTMEGIPAFATIAKRNFAAFGIAPHVKIGEFSSILSRTDFLKDFKPDYVFLDGNHRYEATMDYFHQLLPFLSEDSIVILDDIYWSEGMKKAWNEIAQHPDVSVSIDLFYFGICFVKRKQVKEHFVLFAKTY